MHEDDGSSPNRPRTLCPSKRRQDGTLIGTACYVCGAAITKGKSVCRPVPFLQRVLDDFVLDFVGQRIDAFLGNRGRRRLQELTTKIGFVIDLAASCAEHRGLLKDRLGRLCEERQGIERSLREPEQVPSASRTRRPWWTRSWRASKTPGSSSNTAPWKNASASSAPSWRT